MKTSKNKKAFTLIELLVVVAIIAVLAVVVIVSYGSAKAKTRDSRRMADMEAVKSALLLYKQDHLEFPVNPNETPPGHGSGSFFPSCFFPNKNRSSAHNNSWYDDNCLVELLDGDYISNLPENPKVVEVPWADYLYADYSLYDPSIVSPLTKIGALLSTKLEAYTGPGMPGTFRVTGGIGDGAGEGNTICAPNDNSYCLLIK